MAQEFGPLTMTLRLPGGEVVTVSAFCPVCGIRRHPPPSVLELRAWMNRCGHVNTVGGLLREESSECAAPGCVLLFSERYYPFCSEECACGVSQPVP